MDVGQLGALARLPDARGFLRCQFQPLATVLVLQVAYLFHQPAAFGACAAPIETCVVAPPFKCDVQGQQADNNRAAREQPAAQRRISADDQALDGVAMAVQSPAACATGRDAPRLPESRWPRPAYRDHQAG